MIKKCGIIGLGAVGGMYAAYLTEMTSPEYIYCICSPERLEKYKRNPITVNGKPFAFNFLSSEEKNIMDLVIIATKFHQLPSALEDIKNCVDDHTIILPAINGLYSEEVVKKYYPNSKTLYCVIQGMDSVKTGNNIQYTSLGVMAFGELLNNGYVPEIRDVAKFFEISGFNYEIPFSMKKRMWGKFMLNVGINQVCAVYDGPYGIYQTSGEVRDIYISAIKEAYEVAKAEGVDIDIDYWIKVGDNINPQSMPSMRQDILAKRKTEVEIFGETVIELGKKHSIPTPINIMLTEKIKEAEKEYVC